MSKIKVALVRGRHLNNFEMQSFTPLVGKINLTGFAALTTQEKNFPFPVTRLPSPVDLAYWLSKFKIPVRISLGMMSRLIIESQYLFGLENKLRGFDIAHTADTHYHFTQQCLTAKQKGYVKKVVATVWENIPLSQEGIWGRKKFKQRAIREIDLFLAATKQARNTLITEGCSPEKIKVIYPGIDLKRFKPVKKEPGKIVNLLFVGRLVKEKGIWTIFGAFKKLYGTNKNIRLTLCGSGAEENNLKRAVKENWFTDVVSINQVEYKQMPSVYHKADIFLLASQTTKHWREQFGMVLLEAMAGGVPIIATKSGAIPEVVKESGILIGENDVSALTQNIMRLIADRSLQKAYVKKGLQRIRENFDATKTSQRIFAAYRSILNN